MAVTALLLATAGRASAQPALSYDQLIWVTVGSNDPVKGRLRSWSDSALEWNGPDGVVRTPIGDLQRVEIRDPVADGAWKGALGGFAVGGTVGLLAAVGLACDRDCGEDYSRTRDITSGALGLGAFSAAGGVMLGTLADMFVHRRRVAFQNSPRSRLDMILPGRHGLGAALRVAW